MTLPTVGQIDLGQIGYEAQKPLLTTVDINNADLRKLPNKTTANSQISFADFYGTTYGVGPGYGASDFTNVVGQNLIAQITSNLIYIYGVGSDPVSMAITSGPADAQYSINGGTWSAISVLGSVKNGDSLQVRMTSSSLENTATSMTVTFAGISKSWSITTLVFSVIGVSVDFSLSSTDLMTVRCYSPYTTTSMTGLNNLLTGGYAAIVVQRGSSSNGWKFGFKCASGMAGSFVTALNNKTMSFNAAMSNTTSGSLATSVHPAYWNGSAYVTLYNIKGYAGVVQNVGGTYRAYGGFGLS